MFDVYTSDEESVGERRLKMRVRKHYLSDHMKVSMQW